MSKRKYTQYTHSQQTQSTTGNERKEKAMEKKTATNLPLDTADQSHCLEKRNGGREMEMERDKNIPSWCVLKYSLSLLAIKKRGKHAMITLTLLFTRQTTVGHALL